MLFAGINFCARKSLTMYGADQDTRRSWQSNLNKCQDTANRLSVMGASTGPSIASAIRKAAPLLRGIGKIAFFPLATLFFFVQSNKTTTQG